MSLKGQRLLAFFGSDISETRILQEGFFKGYTLLALDTPAVEMAVKAEIPYTLIDDWIDPETMFRARERAKECELSWFQSVRDKFTLDGICWPEFDHHAMHWFWLDVMLAMELASAIKAKGIQEIKFFRNSKRPAVYYEPSDISISLLDSILKSYRLKSYQETKTFWLHCYRDARQSMDKVIRTLRVWYTKSTNKSQIVPSAFVLKEKVVLALHPGEFYRATPIISQLRDSMQCAAVTLFYDRAVADRIFAEWSIPVIAGPRPVPVDPCVGRQFLAGYRQACNTNYGYPWEEPLKQLSFHFEYYCGQRWPILASTLRGWYELFHVARPKAVIVSQLEDSDSQLPAEAAKGLGIPTFSIPHGAAPGRDISVGSSNFLLYGTQLQRMVFERLGVPDYRLLPCRNLLWENEYPVNPIPESSEDKPWRLLCLMDPTYFHGWLSPNISVRSQLEALQTLDNPPTDIVEKLDIRIKVHPGFPDLQLFNALNFKLHKKVLPPDSELKSTLRERDLIVAVNYGGSALVHCLRAGKPVIFFWKDTFIGRTIPYRYADLFLPAGILVRDSDKFWSVVKRFFTNSEFAGQMYQRAVDFCRSNLDNNTYPSIDEVIRQVVKEVRKC